MEKKEQESGIEQGEITTTEIKKTLYREKPLAKMTDDGKTGIRGCDAITGSTYLAKTTIGNVRLFIPYHEVNSDIMKEEMPAQLLIRWLDGVLSDPIKLS